MNASQSRGGMGGGGGFAVAITTLLLAIGFIVVSAALASWMEPSSTAAAEAPPSQDSARLLIPNTGGIQEGTATYVVQNGDTLNAIAERSNTTIEVIFAMNPSIPSSGALYVGQVLAVPSGIGGGGDAVIQTTAGTVSLKLTPDLAAAGSEITIAGAGFPANSPIQLQAGVDGGPLQTLQTVTSDANGTFLARLTVPAVALAGQDWVIVAADQAGIQYPAASIFQVSAGVLIPPTGGSGMQTYTIQGGDTLGEIAARYNLTADQLLALNPQITDPSLIYPGDVIAVP